MVEDSISGPARLVWSVAALVQAVSDAISARFGACVVRGEISGFSRAASGHCYFNLKDANGGAALVRCAMFRRAAALLDFAPADGHLAEVRGHLAVYEPRGELQFVVEAMQRAGPGALYEEFLRLKAKLEALGLFDESAKRAPARHPRRIGVITSLHAAALSDVLTALARRAPQVEVILYPSLVQGPDAPLALTAAIEVAGRRNEVDTLIVCRGGGSLEDLWAFNDERVVRAIRAAPIPVICGVGHETDVTLADLAADLRAPTPTAAAELSAPSRDELLLQLGTRARSLWLGMEHRMQSAAQGLDRLTLKLRRPDERLNEQRLRLQWVGQRLADRLESSLAQCRERLARIAVELRHRIVLESTRRRHQVRDLDTRLSVCDPYAVVARGYALIETTEAAVVVDPAQLHAGDDLRLTLAHGQADVRLAAVRGKT